MRFDVRIPSLALATRAVLSFAAPATTGAPTVKLDQATFTGVANGATNKFLGIPYAKPPVGDLRFRLPVANDPYTGSLNATSFGFSCPQQVPTGFSIPSVVANDTAEIAELLLLVQTNPPGEDCLTLNIWAPASVPAGTKLPVAFWMYGGGFEDGYSAANDGSILVERSIAMGEPIIYVSINYRLNAFGFLAGKEVKAAGVANIGLQDQRQALRWVQKYISAFNGDPTKVTIWGQSAGAISASLQMLANGGNNEGLFRGAFMESGSPTPIGDISHGQPYYDALVADTGCQSSSDTLECLRQLPYDTLMNAINESPSILSYQSLNLAWQPRADGTFLSDNFQNLVVKGKVANVPFVTGDCDDEATLFSLTTLNITTDDQFRGWVQEFFFPQANKSELDMLLQLYPSNASAGSPFDTGSNNAISPEFKRIAAFQGDFIFQTPRRFFLANRSSHQNAWSYLSKRQKSTFALGSAHGTDMQYIYNGNDLADYLINFVNHLDPNGPTVLSWPQYKINSPQLMTLQDGATPLAVSQDTYRLAPMAYLQLLSLKYPI